MLKRIIYFKALKEIRQRLKTFFLPSSFSNLTTLYPFIVRVEVYCCTCSHSRTNMHSVERFWTNDQPVTVSSTCQHTTYTTDSGLRTRNPSKRVAAESRLKPRGHQVRRRLSRNEINPTGSIKKKRKNMKKCKRRKAWKEMGLEIKCMSLKVPRRILLDHLVKVG